MYRPPAFREENRETLHQMIAERTLGLLVTASAEGLLADPVPFLLDPEAGALGTLRAHLARANPQFAALSDAAECLVVFQGVDAYITPAWYETKRETGKVVPTWNYTAVHAWGKPRIVEDPAWLHAQITALTARMEGRRPEPWAVSDAPEEFIRGQMKGIFGLEIPIARIEGKWKVSQNRPEADRRGVVEGLRGDGAIAMAEIVAARGRLTPSEK